MYKIRKIKYSENSVSIQVYKIENRKRVIVRHIGTARTEEEKAALITLANDFIDKISRQLQLFHQQQSNNVLYLDQIELVGVYYRFFYELISKILITIGFDKLKHNLLLDLVAIRIMEPASKLRSIDLLEEYFGIRHRRQSFYDYAPKWLSLKSKAESITLAFAKEHYDFNFDVLFYDVTTLYFESFTEDELRKNGFSKDNKSQQPQILIALMVNKDGFPISYEIFTGNTFEGHTIIPVINNFIQKHKVNNLTVVADAAMINAENIALLKAQNINYIVGARLGNLSAQILEIIDKQMVRKDGKKIRLQTDLGDLICSYSSVRYRKDLHEMNKQIQKAQYALEHPSKIKKLKFTTTQGQKVELNKKLIEKTQRLLGIKGYYTNLKESEVSDQTIIERYHELYKIEQAFRMSKSDLETRPIFHYKEEPIKLHILICFIALVVSKHIELKTSMSIKKVVHQCKKITDARLKNKITEKEHIIRSIFTTEIKEILSKLNLLT
jgi:hypothetical protein